MKKNYKIRLTRNSYCGFIEFEGDFEESFIKKIKENIGMNFICYANNCSFNLKYFDSVVIEGK